MPAHFTWFFSRPGPVTDVPVSVAFLEALGGTVGYGSRGGVWVQLSR